MRVRHVATRRNMLQHGCSMDAFRHSTARARAGRVGQRRHWLPLLFECIDSVESADDLGADARELVLGLERVRLRLPTADVSALSEQTVYAAVAVAVHRPIAVGLRKTLPRQPKASAALQWLSA